IRRRVVIGQVGADPAGQVGAPGRFDRLDRAAAARTLDDADDRQPQIVRHLLGHQRLFADRRVGRAAAYGEIVADPDDRPSVDLRAAHHAIRRDQLLQFALFVVLRPAGDRTDLVKAAAIDEPVDALAYGEPASLVLALDLVGAAQLARLPLAFAQFVEFRL